MLPAQPLLAEAETIELKVGYLQDQTNFLSIGLQ